MVAILRSSVIQTARHTFSGEGTLSVRALHTGRNNPKVYASRAKVDPLFKKIDDVAKKELVVGYTERLVQELKSSTPSLLGNALQCLVSITAVGAFMLGYQLGFNQSPAENCQASSRKQA